MEEAILTVMGSLQRKKPLTFVPQDADDGVEGLHIYKSLMRTDYLGLTNSHPCPQESQVGR